MPAPWKVVLIGGEVAVLAAFTGVGLHIAMQPHRPGLAPPPALMLPMSSGRPQPIIGTPALVSPTASPSAPVPAACFFWMSGLRN